AARRRAAGAGGQPAGVHRRERPRHARHQRLRHRVGRAQRAAPAGGDAGRPDRAATGAHRAGVGAVKLSTRDAARWLAAPGNEAAVLLHWADPMRVSLKRAPLVVALAGPGAAAEMRLVRLSGADLRRDPAALVDAIKAVGFFPGPRVVVVEEAGDAAAPV